MKTFTGMRIRALRKERGMSQIELGEAIGLGKSAIGMYERGDREPNMDTIEAIADYFNVSTSQITDKNSVGEKLKPVVVDGLSEAEIGFLTQFYLFPENVRAFALSSVEALLGSMLRSPDIQAKAHETEEEHK